MFKHKVREIQSPKHKGTQTCVNQINNNTISVEVDSSHRKKKLKKYKVTRNIVIKIVYDRTILENLKV